MLQNVSEKCYTDQCLGCIHVYVCTHKNTRQEVMNAIDKLMNTTGGDLSFIEQINVVCRFFTDKKIDTIFRS